MSDLPTSKSLKADFEAYVAAQGLSVSFEGLDFRSTSGKEKAIARIRSAMDSSASSKAGKKAAAAQASDSKDDDQSQTAMGTPPAGTKKKPAAEVSPVKQPEFGTRTPTQVEAAFTAAAAKVSEMKTDSNDTDEKMPDAMPPGMDVTSKLRDMMATCERILDGSERAHFIERKLPGIDGDDKDFKPPAEQAIKATKQVPSKIIIFSFYTSVLDAVGILLEAHGYDYFRIDGNVSEGEREAQIEEFKAIDSPKFFLVSVKAGGAGLNLQTANVVMLLDPW